MVMPLVNWSHIADYYREKMMGIRKMTRKESFNLGKRIGQEYCNCSKKKKNMRPYQFKLLMRILIVIARALMRNEPAGRNKTELAKIAEEI